MQSTHLPHLLFGENVGHTFATAEAFYDFVRASAPATLKIPDSKQDFAFKGSMLQLPQMKISNSASNPCQIDTHFASPWFSLVVPITGHGTIGKGNQRAAWSSSDNLILNPFADEQSFTFEGVRSQVLFEIDPARLIRTAASFLGPGVSLNGLASSHTQVVAAPERQQRLKSHLISSLALIDATGRDAEHLARIGFDDVIIRLIIELIAPAGDAARTPDCSTLRRSQRALKLICDQVLAPGSHPLTMTDMERITGVTGRALCYAFNERFGCAPQEWQRNHFLDRAHEELRQHGNAHSIKAISRKFGFSTPHAFTRFYRRRFGHPPTETLRGAPPQPGSDPLLPEYSI